jgi:hypothetical protein
MPYPTDRIHVAYCSLFRIGIAIGPHTWFGNEYGNNVSRSGTVINNRLSGAFSFAMAVTSARNFTIQGNTLFGNTSFIGSRGPNCSSTDVVPNPSPFVVDTNLTQGLSLAPDFQSIPDGNSLTCVFPPPGGDYWPFGGNPSGPLSPGSRGLSGTTAVGIALGLVFGLIAVGIASWFIRKWVLHRNANRRYLQAIQKPGYS